MHVVRKATVKEQMVTFDIDVKAQEFTVKNFTPGDIYVSDVAPVVKDKAILIPAKSGQDITMGKTNTSGETAVNKLYVLPDQTSEVGVEVQATRW